MSAQNLAKLVAPGIDVTVTTSSQVVTLPCSGTSLLFKNVGTGEAFVTAGSGGVTASAASGMSIPAGAIEVYETSGLVTKTLSIIGVAATTLRVYVVEGK